MKKVLKIIGLYLLFGIAIAAVISVCGVYKTMVINQSMGPMSTAEYLSVAGWFAAIWLPVAIFELTSQYKTFVFPFATPIIAGVVGLFLLFSLKIILKKSK